LGDLAARGLMVVQYHISICHPENSFKVLYNQEPPLHLPYLPRESRHKGVDRTMQRREEMVKQVQLNLQKAQERIKHLADKGRSEKVFQVGDWI